MTTNALPRLIIGLAGILVALIGTAILFAPGPFFAANGIALAADAALLSEIRAPGALLAVSGGVLVYLALWDLFLDLAALGACALFGAYGAGRLISFVADGSPGAGLLAATAIELAIALVCLWAWIGIRRSKGVAAV